MVVTFVCKFTFEERFFKGEKMKRERKMFDLHYWENMYHDNPVEKSASERD